MAVSTPLVSIVTPSYNQAAFLEDTLWSVQRQTYSNLEHVVIDDGSTDGSVDILERFKAPRSLRWWSQPNAGQSAAINRGFQLAEGEIVAWLNSDDAYLSPIVVEEAVAALQHRPAVDVVYGDHALITDTGLIFRIVPARRRISLRRLASYCPGQPSMFMRREVVRRFPLRGDLRYRMDYEYWMRLCQEGIQFAYVPQLRSAFRVHAGSNTVAATAASYREMRDVQHRYFNGSQMVRWPMEPLIRRWLGVWLRLRGFARIPQLYGVPLAFTGRRPPVGMLCLQQLMSKTFQYV